MKFRTQLAHILWIPALLVLLAATLARAANAPEIITADELGGADRYLAYVSTDKPIYRTGENVYFRSVILNARNNTPLQDNKHLITVKISGPKGDVVHEGTSYDDESVIGYRWSIPDQIAGGEYTARITSPSLGLPETERTFDIRAFRAPRIKSQIEFTRDGYGPGDLVRASVSIERAEGGIPQGARVTVIARLDGAEIYRSDSQQLTTTGVIDTAFSLPDEITEGEGSLSFLIEDGGIVETASKSLPVLLNKLDISFYPESGDLVAGLKSRVYFQALLANGKPADVQGTIVELHGDEPGSESIVEFSSTHEGRGQFYITPQEGKRYAAVFGSPSGISHPAELPPIANTGTVISSTAQSFAYTDSIEFFVTSNSASAPAHMTLHKREELIDTQNVIGNTVLMDGKDSEGVLIATVWDKQGFPLAERLIYRQPKFELNVEMKLSDGPYVPGAEVSVDVLTTDANGNPTEAVVGLTVTDDTVLELVDKRLQAPRLPVMVYLENEVLDLADAHVYLDKNNPDANAAIDLLLGTQGWRRFVLVDYQNIKKSHPAFTQRAMAHNTSPEIYMARRERKNLMVMEAQIDMPMMAVAPAMVADAENEAIAVDDAIPAPAPPPIPEAIEQQQKVEIVEKRIAKQGFFGDALVGGMDAEMGRMAIAPPNNPVAYVREFAYQPRANRKPNDRIDFTETLYWNSGIKTGARDGRATIKFSLSDSVTTFRVMADAYGRNGALGSGDTMIASVEPFYISTKMPLHAVAADIIELPVTMVNTTDKAINNATLSVSGEGITATTKTVATLAPDERLRSIIKIETSSAGTFPITVTALAGPYSDTVTRSLKVHAAGFPVSVAEGGLLSSATSFNTSVDIPNDVTAGSMVATAKVYPSPLASMEEALNALLRQPHGCFEQTSSTNYPLVMAQQYFESHTGVDPAKIAKAQTLLKAGYSKLISFESKDSGYEWFGANPAHEALTAYGLLEFTDMAKIMEVDPKMIDRTRQWLLDRRDGKGGFKRNERALDSFGRAPAPTTNAYIVWSLLESGQNPATLATEIEEVKAQAFSGNDSYINALAANILYISGDQISAELLLENLATAAIETGAVNGSTTSITGSGGDALSIETTSLAILAWLRNDDQWAAQVEHSVKWLFERSKSGRFGSTQSTVLALKAINAYDAARSVPKAPGSVQLYINGESFGEAVTFNTESKGAIELPDFSAALTAGQHTIELRMADGSKMPFALEITYNTPLPTNATTTPVMLTTALSHTQITEGEPLELKATINVSNVNVPTPIAIIGIPAGLELQHDQLKELVGKDTISAYEVKDSELVLYWRALKAGDTRTVPINLVAEIPGSYTAPASRIYPYYTDEQKLWKAGHSVEVVAR